MAGLRIYRTVFLVVLTCCLMLCLPALAVAQSTERPSVSQQSDVDLEFQLHLLVASNATGESAKLPASLEAIARELRPVLPFSNYRLGATFLSRAKNGKPLSTKGVGRTLLVTPALESSVNPTFYEFSAGTISLRTDAGGREVVQMSPFRFGLRIPLQMMSSRTSGNSEEYSAGVAYEPVGITTDVTMREGVPVVIGTLDAGRPNETLVLVLVAKRAAP